MLQAGPIPRAHALDDVVALGADGCARGAWRDIAPGRARRRRPASTRATPPRTPRPAGTGSTTWCAARRRGLPCSSPLPRRSRPGRRAAAARVAPPRVPAGRRRYGAFVRALGRRYSGATPTRTRAAVCRASPAGRSATSPTRPAGSAAARAPRGITFPPRRCVPLDRRGGDRGLRATRHGGDQMLLGETSPIGPRAAPLARRPAAPGAFIRTLLCIDGKAARCAAARGVRAAAVARGCGERLRPSPVRAGRLEAADYRGDPAREITLGSTGRLERLLDAAAKRGRIPRAAPDPLHRARLPDRPARRTLGVSPARQAAYINESDWIAFRDRASTRSRSTSSPTIRSCPASSPACASPTAAPSPPTPPTGCRCGSAPRASRGCASTARRGRWRTARRPARAPERAAGRGVFATVATFTVRSARPFVRTIPRFEGRWRLRWVPGPGPAECSRARRWRRR